MKNFVFWWPIWKSYCLEKNVSFCFWLECDFWLRAIQHVACASSIDFVNFCLDLLAIFYQVCVSNCVVLILLVVDCSLFSTLCQSWYSFTWGESILKGLKWRLYLFASHICQNMGSWYQNHTASCFLVHMESRVVKSLWIPWDWQSPLHGLVYRYWICWMFTAFFPNCLEQVGFEKGHLTSWGSLLSFGFCPFKLLFKVI